MPDISIFSRFEQGKSIPSGMIVPIKHKFILHFSPKLLDFQPPPVEHEVLLVVEGILQAALFGKFDDALGGNSIG